MSVTFRQVERDEEVEALAHMAYHIWNEYWPAIIGQAQTDYMVEKFQSLNAFRTDIADNGYEYFFIMQHEDETPHELGAATHGADIHDQGDTVAGRVNDDVESDRDDELAHDTEDFARTAAVPRIVGYTGGHVEADTNLYLTVNKHNEMAIRAYKAKGFEVIDAVETDIGDGYIMDDYIMEKKLQ